MTQSPLAKTDSAIALRPRSTVLPAADAATLLRPAESNRA